MGSVEQYILEARPVNSTGMLTLALDGGSLACQTVAPPGLYAARVRAQNACGTSVASNEVIVYVR